MSKPAFDIVWSRIVNCAGQSFQTIQGVEFTYDVDGNILRTDRTNYNLPRSQFDKAYQVVPIDGPGQINRMVRGPAYVWAILHDSQISRRRLVGST